MSLTLDPNLLQITNVTSPEMKEFENIVPTFSKRPAKIDIKIPDDESSVHNVVFVIFDTETSCGGKQAEIIQLAAEKERGQCFSRFTLPTREISPHASRVNKFQTTCVGGKKILHRGGIPLQTVNVSECLQSFVDFLEASQGADKIILIGHNAATFDFPVVLRAFQQYSPHLIEKMMELNVHFADSLVLIHNLIKDKHETLKVAEGSFVKNKSRSTVQTPFRH